MQAPLVLFCNNNQWAISTPLAAQTRAETLADKAVGYGIPGVRVDGGDVLAVFEATRDAVARARAGEGPTFIEAVSYRAAPHATADDPQRVHRSRAGRGGEAPRVPGPLRGTICGAPAFSRTSWRSRSAAEAAEALRAGIAAAEAEPPADVGARCSSTRTPTPPALVRHAISRSCGRSSRWLS